MDNSRSFSHYAFVCLIISLSVLLFMPLSANEYRGRVIDSNGQGISYATVYIAQQPSLGTATGTDGSFVLYSTPEPYFTVIISFIGYEKQEMPLMTFADTVPVTVVLKEQPIALEETVVAAKPHKQRNKRKQMAELLYKVYNQMLYDFPEEPVGYTVVSDVRLNAEQQPWGMEQMIASVVCLPGKRHDGRDSVQFAGQLCKRFFAEQIRSRANEIYAEGQLTDQMLTAASAVDSGVVVHQALWTIGNVRYDFDKTMKDVRHWTVTNESENETVLTHTEKHNFLGMFKAEIKRHYIVNSATYELLRFSEEGDMEIHIPFGYKVKGIYLDLLNIFNMDNQTISKFRMKHAYGNMRLNTIYQRVDGKLLIKEKNMTSDAKLISTKRQGIEIPIEVKATQRATSASATGVIPMTPEQLNQRVPREDVEIF